jgi:thiosulfate reductase/polysulfide reductase chain A
MRHDPFSGLPDPERQKMAMDKCDLLVSIDTHYSEFGWYSDVILPESTYLERDTPICQQKGLKPRLALRRKVLEPRFDTKPNWEIFKQLADRLGIGEYFPYTTIEDLWAWQLEPTGRSIEEFDEKGFVELSDTPIYFDRKELAGQFKTPSGKLEFVSGKLTDAGLPSLKPYVSPDAPPEGMFRLVYGRTAVHTHGHTVNNPLLGELMPVNTLWINTKQAKKLGISDGDLVEVAASDRSYCATVAATVTDHIHPEAVYTVHGFGRDISSQTRSRQVGVSDQKLMIGKLDDWDQAGGGVNLCEAFVFVKKSFRNTTRRVEL